MGVTGFIGLGHMGEGMARNLQSKGHQLAVHDVRNEPVEGLVSLGADNAGSVAAPFFFLLPFHSLFVHFLF